MVFSIMTLHSLIQGEQVLAGKTASIFRVWVNQVGRMAAYM